MRRKYLVLTALVFADSFLHAAALNSSAPKLTLMNSHQQRRALSDYKGKVVFINFWASWCAPCQEELPLLNQLGGDYRGRKVQVLAINVDEDRKAAKRTLQKLGLTNSHLEILWDSKSKVVSTYNIETMPSSFILDQQGIIRFTHAGFHPHDPETWHQEIDSLLKK